MVGRGSADRVSERTVPGVGNRRPRTGASGARPQAGAGSAGAA